MQYLKSMGRRCISKLVKAGEEIYIRNIYHLHSCIHDQIHQWRRPGCKEHSVTPQVYDDPNLRSNHRIGRALLSKSSRALPQKDLKQPIRIYPNYDSVGRLPERDCRSAGEIVKLGEPHGTSILVNSLYNLHGNPPSFGDCWYNCTLEDISGEDKRHRLHKVLAGAEELFWCAVLVLVSLLCWLSSSSLLKKGMRRMMPELESDESRQRANLPESETANSRTG